MFLRNHKFWLILTVISFLLWLIILFTNMGSSDGGKEYVSFLVALACGTVWIFLFALQTSSTSQTQTHLTQWGQNVNPAPPALPGGQNIGQPQRIPQAGQAASQIVQAPRQTSPQEEEQEL